MQTTATEKTATVPFQVNFSNRFRTRDFRIVRAKNDIEAIDKLKVQLKNEVPVNCFAQQITEKEYEKIAANEFNPVCVVSHSYFC